MTGAAWVGVGRAAPLLATAAPSPPRSRRRMCGRRRTPGPGCGPGRAGTAPGETGSPLSSARGPKGGRSPAIAQQVTRLLYPALDEAATLELTDAFLEKPDLPAGCRRLVLEQRDDVARAIRAATAT